MARSLSPHKYFAKTVGPRSALPNVDVALGYTNRPVTDERSLIARVIDFANGETTIDMDAQAQRYQYSSLESPSDVRYQEVEIDDDLGPMSREISREEVDRENRAQLESAKATAREILRSSIGIDPGSPQSQKILAEGPIPVIKRYTLKRLRGEWSLGFQLDGSDDARAWLAFAQVLLRIDFDGVRSDLGLCRLERCSRFFVIERGGLGKPRKNYCDPKHREAHHNGPDSTRRSRNARKEKRDARRLTARKPK